MNSKKARTDIIDAAEEAVKQLIKVAKEKIITEDPENDLAADRLKNAAATKKLAIFDAFEIISRIEQERESLNEASESADKSVGGFAERRSK
jgi:hypothetical protein